MELGLRTSVRFALQRLHQGVGALVEVVVTHGAVKAARALSNELGGPDAALAAELEAASKEEEVKRQELARLQGLERDLDPLTGSNSRMLVSVVVGLIWVISPLFGWLQAEKYPDVEMVSTAPIALLSAVVLLIFGRHTRQGRTPLNRQLMSVTVFGMLVQAVFVTSYYRAVGDLGRFTVLSGYWFLLSGAMTVALLPPIWPTSLAYLLSALGALFHGVDAEDRVAQRRELVAHFRRQRRTSLT